MNEKIKKILKKRTLILDGATGTMLHKRGMPKGVAPEKWCLENKNILLSLHCDYIKAGADVIYTATFGANCKKMKHYGISNITSLNKELASIAKKASRGEVLVAGDIGPLGEFVKPFGSLDFEEAVLIFKKQVKGLLLAGVDLFVIETMMDIQEARAALLAVKEMSDKFTMVTMTYQKSGSTLNGNDPISSLITLQSLGADAIGCNCSTGPLDMIEVISKMNLYAKVPLIAKPNAGVPKFLNNEAVFDMSPDEFAVLTAKLVSKGASIVGGCCGTTPLHIEAVRKKISKNKKSSANKKPRSLLSSARGFIDIQKSKSLVIVGEKINPTGKKEMQKELLNGSMNILRKLARLQESQGARLLDVNVGVPGIDEKKTMLGAISVLSVITDLPLVIDSSDTKVIEAALRFYPGRALINSITAEKKKLDSLLHLAKKYGAMFVALPLSGKEIPLTFAKRKALIESIINRAKSFGLNKNDIVVDALIMAVSCNSKAAIVSLETIEWCSKALKINTIGGVSNVSFGLPRRDLLNASFIKLARKKGLKLAIADPVNAGTVDNKSAENILLSKDKGGLRFIKRYAGTISKKITVAKTVQSHEELIERAILDANKEQIESLIKEALDRGVGAYELMQKIMTPAIVKVGELFEKRSYFLPQLIASAETLKKGFSYLERFIKKDDLKKAQKAVIVFATVEGDIHDIGKNIVTLMLNNHGFKIIDLGRDVSAEKIVRAIKEYRPDIVGLSALMTTTMVNIKDVIDLADKQGLSPKFMVGGAVLNQRYAASIGAEYAKDGVSAVKLAEKLWKSLS